jgi:hypothetical protein
VGRNAQKRILSVVHHSQIMTRVLFPLAIYYLYPKVLRLIFFEKVKASKV